MSHTTARPNFEDNGAGQCWHCDKPQDQHPEEEAHTPVTVLHLARYRGLRTDERGSSTMGDFDKVGLPMIGGCEVCGATIAAYNAAPSTSGFLRCASRCIGDDGFDTVEEANIALFPEEYEWKGELDA